MAILGGTALTPKQTNQARSPIPGMGGALQGQLLAKQAYENALARISQKRNESLLTAGYTANFGSNGAYTNLRVNPNSPYGGLQTMLRNQAGEDQQAQFLGQERGLRGGLANQALTELQYAHGGQSAEFGRNLLGELDTDIADQRDALTEYNRTLYEQELQAARDAIAAQQFNPGDYSGGGDSGGGNDNSGNDNSGNDNSGNDNGPPSQGSPGIHNKPSPKKKVAKKVVKKYTAWVRVK